MNGKETTDELNACLAWDTIYQYGPLTTLKIAELNCWQRKTAERIVDRDWFVKDGYKVCIAMTGGER